MNVRNVQDSEASPYRDTAPPNQYPHGPALHESLQQVPRVLVLRSRSALFLGDLLSSGPPISVWASSMLQTVSGVIAPRSSIWRRPVTYSMRGVAEDSAEEEKRWDPATDPLLRSQAGAYYAA